MYSKDFQILYSGEWKDNLPHGKGISYNNKEGKKVEVVFEEGIDQRKL